MSKDLFKISKQKKIKYFLISFVDLFGVLRSKLVPAHAIKEMQTVGAGFAGWYIQIVIGNLALNSRNVNQNSPLSSDRVNSLASEMIVASNLDSLETPSQPHDLSSIQRGAAPSVGVYSY